jgi:hypothetical protein
MGVHIRVDTRTARRSLHDLIEQAQPGQVYELIDGRRRTARVRAYIIVAAPDQEVVTDAQP